MPIPVVCPYCSAKIKAPDSLAGKQATCPKCKSQLSIPPLLPAPNPPTTAAPVQYDPVPVYYPPMPPAPLYPPSLSYPHPYGQPPAPVQPPPFTEVPTTHVEVHNYTPRERRGSSFASGFGAGCGAMLGWIVGGLLALAGLVFLFCGGLFSPTKQEEAPATAAEQWIDASSKTVVVGNSVISIPSAQVGPVALATLTGPGESDKPYLAITVRVRNTDSTRRLPYRRWSKEALFGSPPATLADEFGNQYRHVTFGIDQVVGQQRQQVHVNPGESVDDLLVFEVPIPRARSVFLTLAAEEIDSRGVIRFRLPESMFRRGQ
jgi:hypothetical protein